MDPPNHDNLPFIPVTLDMLTSLITFMSGAFAIIFYQERKPLYLGFTLGAFALSAVLTFLLWHLYW